MTLPYVPPDGPVPCRLAVVGEAPASEEVREGRGFVGPSGRMLWPLMRRLALVNRDECYVTNLCKHPLDNDVSGEAKLSEAEFAACAHELWGELARVQPERVLAVGALAARALLGERYTRMEVCNGIGFKMLGTDCIAVPTWHPAAALRPGGEDRLAYTAAAIKAFGTIGPMEQHPMEEPTVPPLADYFPVCDRLGIDTEGTPEDPICMTVATSIGRWYVPADKAWGWLSKVRDDTVLVFHNALWDWRVLWAMGVPRDIATRWRWIDTMEKAYLRQTEPRALKDLAYRHLGLRMRDFGDVVLPHYDAMVRAAAAGRIAAGSVTVTHSPKGKLLKRPKVMLDDRVKPLKRALDNPALLAKRMPGALPWPRPDKHSALSSVLRVVPQAELVEYATMDAWATVMLAEKGCL